MMHSEMVGARGIEPLTPTMSRAYFCPDLLGFFIHLAVFWRVGVGNKSALRASSVTSRCV